MSFDTYLKSVLLILLVLFGWNEMNKVHHARDMEHRAVKVCASTTYKDSPPYAGLVDCVKKFAEADKYYGAHD